MPRNGSRVVLHSMVTRSSLNGRIGTVKGVTGGNVRVTLDGKDAHTLHVPAGNLATIAAGIAAPFQPRDSIDSTDTVELTRGLACMYQTNRRRTPPKLHAE